MSVYLQEEMESPDSVMTKTTEDLSSPSATLPRMKKMSGVSLPKLSVVDTSLTEGRGINLCDDTTTGDHEKIN